MSKIIKNGASISLGEVDSIESKLPLGIYNLEYNEMFGFRLSETEQFILPPKIYGDTSIIQRSIAVYKNRPRNFGLLLSGLRGSGKSLVMKKLALELNQPVIILLRNLINNVFVVINTRINSGIEDNTSLDLKCL